MRCPYAYEAVFYGVLTLTQFCAELTFLLGHKQCNLYTDNYLTANLFIYAHTWNFSLAQIKFFMNGEQGKAMKILIFISIF